MINIPKLLTYFIFSFIIMRESAELSHASSYEEHLSVNPTTRTIFIVPNKIMNDKLIEKEISDISLKLPHYSLLVEDGYSEEELINNWVLLTKILQEKICLTNLLSEVKTYQAALKSEQKSKIDELDNFGFYTDSPDFNSQFKENARRVVITQIQYLAKDPSLSPEMHQNIKSLLARSGRNL